MGWWEGLATGCTWLSENVGGYLLNGVQPFGLDRVQVFWTSSLDLTGFSFVLVVFIFAWNRCQCKTLVAELPRLQLSGIAEKGLIQGAKFDSSRMAEHTKVCPRHHQRQEFTQKLKFLAAMLPKEHLDQLAPGGSFCRGRRSQESGTCGPSPTSCVDSDWYSQLLVDTLGGSRGSSEAEERSERCEKSLRGATQTMDESHDARVEANFTELLARNTTLEEVQACSSASRRCIFRQGAFFFRTVGI
jgi:hypothetical protein